MSYAILDRVQAPPPPSLPPSSPGNISEDLDNLYFEDGDEEREATEEAVTVTEEEEEAEAEAVMAR
jgi:hypothetical protein